jgi:hypothetical protein
MTWVAGMTLPDSRYVMDPARARSGRGLIDGFGHA